jgi:hypothetical protein
MSAGASSAASSGLDHASTGHPHRGASTSPCLLQAHRPRAAVAESRLGFLPGLQPVPHCRHPAGHHEARALDGNGGQRPRGRCGQACTADGRGSLGCQVAAFARKDTEDQHTRGDGHGLRIFGTVTQELSKKLPQRLHGRAHLSERVQCTTKTSEATTALPAIPGADRRSMEQLKDEGAARPGCGTCSCRRSPRAPGGGLSNLDYAPLCEIMGRVPAWAPEVFNCNGARHRQHGDHRALRHRRAAQAPVAADPLLEGRIRSAFADDRARALRPADATNIAVAASSAKAITTSSTAASGGLRVQPDPRCKILHPDGQDRSGQHLDRHRAAVDDPGAERRAGREDPALPCAERVRFRRRAARPHARSNFKDVKVPVRPTSCSAKGRGFEIAQGRLGPGPHTPLHAPDRPGRTRPGKDVQAAPPARTAFGRKPVAEQGVTRERIAEARIMIDSGALHGA